MIKYLILVSYILCIILIKLQRWNDYVMKNQIGSIVLKIN